MGLSEIEVDTSFGRLRAHPCVASLGDQPCTSRTPSAAVCFWHGAGQGGGDPICPEVAITGLQSAVDRFDVVELLHYQPFVRVFFVQKIPSLVMVDASEYLSEAQFKELFDRGVGIRTLADVVRVRRLLRRNGGC